MSCHASLLRTYYTGNQFVKPGCSLKSTDGARKTSLLSKFSPRSANVSLSNVKLQNGFFMCELENVLSREECNEIIETANESYFQEMAEKYGQERNNSRLLVFDEMLASNLWQNIQPTLTSLLDKLQIPTQPLGFDVIRGKWELHGLNEAMRINCYVGKKEQYFRPHKDAQYCPSGDERSLFTLIVYLNEEFKGGETCFYFPKDVSQCTKGMTTQEEIDAFGGVKEGFDCVQYIPSGGHAVLFSHDLLHESLPTFQGNKYILKTDIVVKRHSKQFGFTVEEREKVDYIACLSYFKEAQQQELQRNYNNASNLYEKALSIRYSYPKLLSSNKPVISDDDPDNGFSLDNLLPLNVWYEIFKYLPGRDRERLVYAYPALYLAKISFERHEYLNAACLLNEKYLPSIKYHRGIVTCFEFPDAEFFKENESGCCRVAAMYSFFLLGQKPDDDVYTVRYNPDTQDVCVVALETLLTDVFYNHPCYGSFYNVRQQDAMAKDPNKDFGACVERSYMLLRHGAEFTGVELQNYFDVTSTAYPLSDQDDDDTDDDDDDGDDDSDDDGDDDSDDDDDNDTNNDGNKEKEKAEMGNKKTEEIGKEQNDIEEKWAEKVKATNKNQEEKRKCKVITDGTVPFYGEIGASLDVMWLVRMHIRLWDRNELCLEDTNAEEGLYGDITQEDENIGDGHSLYFDTLEEINTSKNLVSCALISKLKEELDIKPNSVCVCMHSPNYEVVDYIGGNCTTEFYNHLVFDFESSELSVQCSNGESCEDNELFHPDHFEAICKEQKLIGCTGETKYYRVDIKPLLSSGTSFNHASCQCGNPNFKVHEYYNIKDYPYLDHIHLTARELDGKMMVWVIYGGIVAL